MQIHFLGVGEACDGKQPNTSILLKTERREENGRILLDCGFSVPHEYFSLNPSAEELQMLWISHFHGDHFLGTPLLLLWLWEMKRSEPLRIIGPPGIEAAIKNSMDLAYPNLLGRLGFPLIFSEIKPGERKKISDTVWQAADNDHSQPCLSLRLETHDSTIFYSGDGRPTPITQSMAMGCDIIIHEAYGIEDTTPGHGSISTCLEFARNAGVKRLALVHMQRDVRIQAFDAMKDLRAQYMDLEIIIPERGSSITL